MTYVVWKHVDDIWDNILTTYVVPFNSCEISHFSCHLNILCMSSAQDFILNKSFHLVSTKVSTSGTALHKAYWLPCWIFFSRNNKECSGYHAAFFPPNQVPPPRDQLHPPPRSRYTPRDQVHPPTPWDQVHPPRTRYPPRPGTPPRTRYTPPGPGTPPDQVHPPPGDTVYARAVRILLECILVFNSYPFLLINHYTVPYPQASEVYEEYKIFYF